MSLPLESGLALMTYLDQWDFSKCDASRGLVIACASGLSFLAMLWSHDHQVKKPELAYWRMRGHVEQKRIIPVKPIPQINQPANFKTHEGSLLDYTQPQPG